MRNAISITSFVFYLILLKETSTLLLYQNMVLNNFQSSPVQVIFDVQQFIFNNLDTAVEGIGYESETFITHMVKKSW